MQTPEEFAEDFREWMVANAQWPMLGDANATRKLEQIIRARDSEIRRECAERAITWLKTLHHEPEPGLPWSEKIKRMQELQIRTLRAAITGEEE